MQNIELQCFSIVYIFILIKCGTFLRFSGKNIAAKFD